MSTKTTSQTKRTLAFIAPADPAQAAEAEQKANQLAYARALKKERAQLVQQLEDVRTRRRRASAADISRDFGGPGDAGLSRHKEIVRAEEDEERIARRLREIEASFAPLRAILAQAEADRALGENDTVKAADARVREHQQQLAVFDQRCAKNEERQQKLKEQQALSLSAFDEDATEKIASQLNGVTSVGSELNAQRERIRAELITAHANAAAARAAALRTHRLELSSACTDALKSCFEFIGEQLAIEHELAAVENDLRKAGGLDPDPKVPSWAGVSPQRARVENVLKFLQG